MFQSLLQSACSTETLKSPLHTAPDKGRGFSPYCASSVSQWFAGLMARSQQCGRDSLASTLWNPGFWQITGLHTDYARYCPPEMVTHGKEQMPGLRGGVWDANREGIFSVG